jgi:hypothetical protein
MFINKKQWSPPESAVKVIAVVAIIVTSRAFGFA